MGKANLIMGGTNRFSPLRNALCALKKGGKDIDAIYLIDTPETAKNSCHIIKNIKEALNRSDILVSSLEVNEKNAVELIPELMAQFIAFDRPQKRELIVDLTTGPKYITSLLYATANFCGVNNIYYFLLKNGERSNLNFEELNENDDYQYIHLPTFKNESLEELSQRSHMDIIYYLKDVENLVEVFEPKSPRLANEINSNLRLAVFDYFNNRYKSSILSVGSLLETWTYRINDLWMEQGAIACDNSQNKNIGRKWNNELQRMARVCKILRESRSNEVHENCIPEKQIIEYLPLAMSYEMIDLVRKYRNMAAHVTDNRYQIERDDAKLVLDIGFSFVNKCKEANFLLGYCENHDDISFS